MSAARFARLLVVPDGPGRSDNRLTCGGSGGGALDGGQTCGNDGPPAPCREDFAHLGDGQERAYRQARNKWAAAGKKRKRHESKHAERDAKVHHDAARAQIMRLRCGETQDAAESLAAYLLRGGSGDPSYGSSDWCVAATLVRLPSTRNPLSARRLSEFILLMSMEATYSAVEKAAAASLALSEPATRFMIEKMRSLAVQWRDLAASTFQQEQDSQVCALLSSAAYCDDVQLPPMLPPKLAALASVLAAPKTVDIEASDAQLQEYEAHLDRLREKRRASEQRTAERKAGVLPAKEPEAEAASLERYLREREEREKLRALCRAIEEGDEATARAWLDGGGQINAMYEYERDSKGQPMYRTLLGLAARGTGGMNGRAKQEAALVHMLLQRGAEINQQDGRGETALMLAAEGGNVLVVDILLRHGAEVNLRDNQGWTALVCASFYSMPDRARHATLLRLLQAGAIMPTAVWYKSAVCTRTNDQYNYLREVESAYRMSTTPDASSMDTSTDTSSSSSFRKQLPGEPLDDYIAAFRAAQS